ncbi:MAG TPA: hypothetical protein VL200_10300 [Lacunisphaera sp.]|jgi:hypothetical protein|nr:hypothetical protein [Lacunisphaera sp.]
MKRARYIRVFGAVVLAAGLAAAVMLYVFAPEERDPGLIGVDVPTNAERHQLERMGGKTYVLAKDFSDWFGSLWHGRRLAYTVGALSLAGFLGARWAARSEAAADNEPQ